MEPLNQLPLSQYDKLLLLSLTSDYSCLLSSGSRSLRSAAEERAMNNVVANAMAEAFNPRSSDALRSAADGVLKACPLLFSLWYRNYSDGSHNKWMPKYTARSANISDKD